MSDEDSLDSFIVEDMPYDGYEGESDEEDSMEEPEGGCTFYSDATDWDRRVAIGEHKIYGVLQTYARSSRWAADRWRENRERTIEAVRNSGLARILAENEAETPTSVSSTAPEPLTDEERSQSGHGSR